MDGGIVVFLVFLMMDCCFSLKTDEYKKVNCMDRLYDLEDHTHSSNGELFKLSCPLNCAGSNYPVIGSGPYLGTSSICRAAIHSGMMGDDGHVLIETINKFVKAFNGATTRNGVRSESADYVGTGGFSVLEIKTPPTTVASIVKTNTSRHGFTSRIETVPNLASQAPTVASKSSLQTSSTTQKSMTSSGRLHSSKLMTSTLMQHNTEYSERQLTTQTLQFHHNQATSHTQTTRLGDEEDIMDVTKTKSTTKPESVMPMRTVTNSSHRFLDEVEVTGGVVISDDIFAKTTEKIVLILMFVVGVLFAIMLMVLRKKRKKLWRNWRRKQQRRSCDSKDDEELCVCYQTLDASAQGLLYDPDTCARPCAKKKQEVQDFNLQTQSKASKLMKKQEICYEDECGKKCSGNCNPEMFEF